MILSLQEVFVGKIINRGTNYVSFVDEDNKVHKAWLHEINVQ